jgi:uncharacterized membrane protein
MKYLKKILMIAVPAVILNVWLLRFNLATSYRGGNATNMLEEFAVYGLNHTIAYLVGSLKIIASIGLLAGFYFEKAIKPAATMIAILMIGAIAMHLKVADDAIKFLPAGLMFLFSSVILLLQNKIIK